MSNRNKIIISAIIIALVFGYVGYKIGQSRTIAGSKIGFSNRQFSGQGMNNRKVGNGLANGDIVSKDEKSITIKLRNGSTQIILVSPSTEVMKMMATNHDELVVGKSVSVIGKSNADGSVTATSIQIRPIQAGGPAAGGQGGPIGN